MLDRAPYPVARMAATRTAADVPVGGVLAAESTDTYDTID